MGIGQTGKYDRNYRRFVRKGGRLLFNRRWYQHACLLDWIDKEIVINTIGWCPGIDLYQCWYPGGTARKHVKGDIIILDLEPLPLD